VGERERKVMIGRVQIWSIRVSLIFLQTSPKTEYEIPLHTQSQTRANMRTIVKVDHKLRFICMSTEKLVRLWKNIPICRPNIFDRLRDKNVLMTCSVTRKSGNFAARLAHSIDRTCLFPYLVEKLIKLLLQRITQR